LVSYPPNEAEALALKHLSTAAKMREVRKED